MQPRKPNPGKPYSNILPGVIAAFLGATLVLACERPANRVAGAEEFARNAPQQPASSQAPMDVQRTPTAAPAAAPRPTMPSRESITDTVITGRIKTALLTDPGMAGADVSVNTDRGVVSLAGTVKSHEQTGIASAHAQRQDGVMRVDTHLSVDPE